jgi:hypothetical protein
VRGLGWAQAPVRERGLAQAQGLAVAQAQAAGAQTKHHSQHLKLLKDHSTAYVSDRLVHA